jgi:hypothetical protein
MLSVIYAVTFMLSAVRLSAVMLNVVAPAGENSKNLLQIQDG